MTLPTVSIAVFAYNEEERIQDCLDAIAAMSEEARIVAHILINGCTDGTERVVRGYQARGFELRAVHIGRGDKANAWNHYVHAVAPEDAQVHVFTDGDMTITKGSIAGFLRCFDAHPEANGMAGLPATGRSRQALRDQLVNRREMAGNLYALRGTCLAEFRRRRVRLPVGLFGEDGLVTTLVKYGLDTLGPRVDARVTATEQGGFAFRALSPWSLGDLRIYRNRKRRYALRQLQAEMLYPLLYEKGVGAMPEHVIDLYRARFPSTRLGWRGLDTIFAWEARQRVIRDLAKADEAVKAEDRAHLYS
jgi:glycosyltransferase involved in cell wall biosynthesis